MVPEVLWAKIACLSSHTKKTPVNFELTRREIGPHGHESSKGLDESRIRRAFAAPTLSMLVIVSGTRGGQHDVYLAIIFRAALRTLANISSVLTGPFHFLCHALGALPYNRA